MASPEGTGSMQTYHAYQERGHRADIILENKAEFLRQNQKQLRIQHDAPNTSGKGKAKAKSEMAKVATKARVRVARMVRPPKRRKSYMSRAWEPSNELMVSQWSA